MTFLKTCSCHFWKGYDASWTFVSFAKAFCIPTCTKTLSFFLLRSALQTNYWSSALCFQRWFLMLLRALYKLCAGRSVPLDSPHLTFWCEVLLLWLHTAFGQHCRFLWILDQIHLPLSFQCLWTSFWIFLNQGCSTGVTLPISHWLILLTKCFLLICSPIQLPLTS